MRDALLNKLDTNSSMIEKNFSKAASQYDQAALAQRFAADLVAHKTLEYVDFLQGLSANQNLSALEIGCGTGLLTHQLAYTYPWQKYVATDISKAMLSVCEKRCRASKSNHLVNHLCFEVLDANALAFDQTFDLITSSLCLQWVADFFSVLDTLYAQSNLLVVSVLLDSSFMNWRNAHAEVNELCRLQPLVNLENIQQWLASKHNQGARVSISEKITFTQHFESPLAFPRSLKAIGAHTPITTNKPTNLHKVARACIQPFSVNYDIGLIILA